MNDRQNRSRPRGGKPGFLARLRARLFAGAAMAAALTGVQAQAPGPVPEHWVSYATMTGNHLQARLSSGSGDLVTRLHEWLESRPAQAGSMPVPVVVRIWISPDGEITRSQFESLGGAQADADLRAILSAHPLPEAPPADMLQPLVLGLTLQANPDYRLQPSE